MPEPGESEFVATLLGPRSLALPAGHLLRQRAPGHPLPDRFVPTSNKLGLIARIGTASLSAQGPRLGRWFGPADGGWMPRVYLSGAIYTKAALREGDASDTVHYAPSDQYAFNVRRSDANSNYRYPFMQQEPGASGASVSMAMA